MVWARAPALASRSAGLGLTAGGQRQASDRRPSLLHMIWRQGSWRAAPCGSSWRPAESEGRDRPPFPVAHTVWRKGRGCGTGQAARVRDWPNSAGATACRAMVFRDGGSGGGYYGDGCGGCAVGSFLGRGNVWQRFSSTNQCRLAITAASIRTPRQGGRASSCAAAAEGRGGSRPDVALRIAAAAVSAVAAETLANGGLGGGGKFLCRRQRNEDFNGEVGSAQPAHK